MIRRLIGEDLDFIVDTCPGSAVARIDLGGLDQVVMNLAVNARDAMPGGGSLALSTRRAREGDADWVLLSVRDTGTGIPPDVRARLFEPFFTTKPVGQGTGLGLAVCHGIVRQAGGSIQVESAPGKGATFTLRLPGAGATPASPSPETVPASSPVGGQETLLIVEDEPMILEMASLALEPLGYRILTAPDGPSALAAAGTHDGPIHLLVTDVIMPRMGGRELASRLQALRPGIRVLYASGYTDEAVDVQGVLEDGIQFLQKPYTPPILAARIREVLDPR
jgi:CheY-like chemotaxis protein